MKYYDQYVEIHKKKKYGTSGDRIAGQLLPHIPGGINSLLDYGAGQSNTAEKIAKARGIKRWYAYDPCVEGREKKPHEDYDFFICTDVLEHVPEEELDELFTTLWGYAERGIFVIALQKAHEILPNGENAHCTVKPKEWWRTKLLGVWREVKWIPDIQRGQGVAAFFVSQ